MGRATVVGGGAEGRYTIRLDVGESLRSRILDASSKNVEALTQAVSAASAEAAEAEAKLAAARAAADAALQAYIDAVEKWGPTHIEAGDARAAFGKAMAQAANARMLQYPLSTNRDTLAERLAAAQRRHAHWAGLPLSEDRQAWCVDLTESASGEVATIEIGGESDHILIQPGGRKPTPADGALLSRELMSPEQSWLNVAMLPGWQRHQPMFRRGTITALDVDANTASVQLAPAKSSAQRLDINARSTLAGVPVTYMTCHAAAFLVGDQVVVAFDADWATPRVIGFVSYPRACDVFTLRYYTKGWSGGAWVSLPQIVQQVYRGRDADPVSTGAPSLPYCWIGWDDGVTTLTRHDKDIQESDSFDALYSGWYDVLAGINPGATYEAYLISQVEIAGKYYYTAGVRGYLAIESRPEHTYFHVDTISFDVVVMNNEQSDGGWEQVAKQRVPTPVELAPTFTAAVQLRHGGRTVDVVYQAKTVPTPGSSSFYYVYYAPVDPPTDMT